MKNMILALVVCLSAVGTQGAEKPEMKMDQSVAKATVHRTTGVVRSLDAAKGTVTLAHEAVPSLKWPAMVMPFKISPEQAGGLQVGQKVSFEFEAQDMNATIIQIAAAK